MRTMLNALGARRAALQNDTDRQKGFTLIELLVVVIIIGILAAVAIPVYLGVQSSAKDNAVKADLTNLKTAVVAYQTQNPNWTPADITLTKLESTVKLDPSNYKAGALPTIKATATSICITATGSNDSVWGVKDTGAPVKDEKCA